MSTGAVQAASTLVLAIFTVLLAVATLGYYRETKKHTEELRNQRQATERHTDQLEKDLKVNNIPRLKATVRDQQGIVYWLSLENVGNGPAIGVEATWGFEEFDHQEAWEIPLMVEGEAHQFPMPFPPSRNGKLLKKEEIEERLDGRSSTVNFEFRYTDLFGNRVDESDRVEVIPVIESWGDTKERVQMDELRKIRKALEEISEEIS